MGSKKKTSDDKVDVGCMGRGGYHCFEFIPDTGITAHTLACSQNAPPRPARYICRQCGKVITV